MLALFALSEGAWAAIGVIVTAFAGVLGILIKTKGDVKQTKEHVTKTKESVEEMAIINALDHGNVALAIVQLGEKIDEHHRRNGERFERMGHRLGDLATRQERMNDRIDDVIKAQHDHLEHHLRKE